MADLAKIGFSADTSELREAKAVLQSLPPAARKVDEAAGKLANTVEKTGRSAKSATDALNGTASATDKLSVGAGKATGATERLDRGARGATSSVERLNRAANDNVAATSRMTTETTRAGAALQRMNTVAASAGASIAGMARGWIAAAAAMATVGAAMSAGRGILETTANYQRLQGALETVTGSAQKAQQAFAFAQDFAKTTPFDVAQVTEAIIKLKSLGLTPTEASLTSFGNTASAMGKNLMQFIEAVADATTGEFERLKEFGIKASQDGEKVSLTFQGVTKTIGNNAQEIQKYLIDIGNTQFAGGMDKQASLLGGSFSALGDSIANFQYAIGNGGFASAVQAATDGTAAWLDKNHELAAVIGGALGTAVSAFSSYVQGVVNFYVELYRWIEATITVVGTFFNSFNIGATQATTALSSVSDATSFLGDLWMATGEIILNVLNSIIGAFVGAYNVIVENWSRLPEAFEAIAKAASNALVEGIESAINGVTEGINNLFGALNNALPEFAQLGQIGATSLEDFKFKADETTVAVTDSAAEIMNQAMSVDYLSNAINGALAPFAQFGGAIAEAKQKADEARAASEKLASGVKNSLPDLSGPAAATAGAIDSGVTKPSKEATKALREAEAAKKALFSEADAAVAEFFPVAAAEKEAARIQALIDDTSNGLTSLQRAALGAKIDQGFKDANEKLANFGDNAKSKTEEVGDSIKENIGDTLSDIFAGAMGDADNFFSNIMKGFIGIHNQNLKLGFDMIFGGGKYAPGAASSPAAQSTGSALATASGLGKADLGALNTGLKSASKSALDVARQFEGLNERADSKVLDSFLQASGNWKGLSAKSTAWCAAFANAALMQSGQQGTGSNLASSFLDWGQGTNNPKPGDIVVLKPQSRGSSGHVGFVAGFGDGSVQVFGGNQSNGANTKSFGLDQVASYRTVATLQTATTKGVTAGLDKWANMREGNVVAPVSAQAQQGGAGGLIGNFLSSPIAQIGMNALGAFGAGQQSASPIMGGLSGALSGFASGGPVGAVIGGIAGLVGGLFGSSAKKKQEREQQRQKEAQQAQMAAALATQSEELTAYFNRSATGNLSEELRKTDQKIRELRASIKNDGIKSEDTVDALEKEALEYKELLTREFRDVFDTVSGNIGAGLGLDSDFNKARESIQELGKQYRGFVEDTQNAYRVPTELRDQIMSDFKAAEAAAKQEYASAASYERRARNGSSDDYSLNDRNKAKAATDKARKEMDVEVKAAKEARDLALAEYEKTVADLQAKYEAAVAKAVESAREGLLRVVSGDIPEQTDIERKLAESQGAAAALGYELQQLGLNAQQAADAIEGALNKRMELMRDEFNKGLTDQINSLNDKGYFAEVRDFLEDIEKMRADAGRVGGDASLVEEYFKAQAQEIVDNAELTGDAFNELIEKFPALKDVVSEFADSLDTVAERIKSYQDRYFDALNNSNTLEGALAAFERRAIREREEEKKNGNGASVYLEAALAAEKVQVIQNLLRNRYEEERQDIESNINKVESFRDSISDMLDSMKIDKNLSPLDAQGRFLEAQKQFQETAAKAAAGDEEAQTKLAGISQAYLTEARDFYGTSERYYQVFEEVESRLTSAKTVADQQLSIMKAQLEVAQKELAKLDKVDSSIVNLGAAIKALAEAQTAANAAAAAANAAGGGGAAGPVAPVTSGGTVVPTMPKSEIEKFLDVQYQAILGRAPDAAGVNFYTQVRGTGATAEDIINMIKNSPEAKARGFYDGGYTGNRPATESVAFVHGQEYVLNADATRSIGVGMLDYMNDTGQVPIPSAPSSGDNSGVVEAINRLKQAVLATGAQNAEKSEQVRTGIYRLARAMEFKK